MNRSERKKFVLVISALASAFNREADQATFKAYKWGLDGIPIEAIEHACISAIRTCQRMPTPAELRELGGEKSPRSLGLLAWESFTQAVRQYGGNASVDFDDRTINAVVRNLGGWKEVTLLGGEEFYKWLRHRFLDAYEKLSRLNLDSEVVAPLIGELDINNTFGKSEPLRIECLSIKKFQAKIEGPDNSIGKDATGDQK